jgi:hypothetical protein
VTPDARGNIVLKLKEHDYLLLREAVANFITDVNNEIVTCPDEALYVEEIAVLEYKHTRLLLLKERFK